MALSRSQCFTILGLAEGTGLEEIKAAYRKLAFKLHPDLNPGDPQASTKFQRLNEAYVCLSNEAEKQPGGAGASRGKGGPKGARPGPKARASEAAGAYQRQKHRSAASASSAGKAAGGPTSPGGGQAQQQTFYYKQEEVLRDILKDPFAKQVFEDIYRQVKREGTPSRVKKRKLKLQWGDKALDLDVSKGVWGGIKSWFKGQLDDEQTLYFPPHHLIPGKAVRIRVEQSFAKGPKNVEVRLPHDFVIGRPIRLKGLGRRLGPLKGDLYLRIMPK